MPNPKQQEKAFEGHVVGVWEQDAGLLEVWGGDLSPRICDTNVKLGCGPKIGWGRDIGRCNGICGTGPY